MDNIDIRELQKEQSNLIDKLVSKYSISKADSYKIARIMEIEYELTISEVQ